MKVCNRKIIHLIFTMLLFFVLGSCKTENYVDKIFTPSIDIFVFNSLNLKQPELIKSVIQSDEKAGTKIEFLNGKAVSKSDFYIEEPSGDYPPNFEIVFDYDINGFLRTETTYINYKSPNNLMDETIFEYNNNFIIQKSVSSVVLHEIKKKLNGYEMFTENKTTGEKFHIIYNKTRGMKKTIREYNGIPENESAILVKNGKEYPYYKADVKDGKKNIYLYQEITKYKDNLINEISTYNVNSNGEKILFEKIIIENYDKYNNWVSAKIYDADSCLKKIYKQDIEYLD